MSPPIHPLTSSQGAVFLINSWQEYFHCAPSYEGEALFRSYGCFFAEFLGDTSLVRLGLLDLTTCVGLRYGPFLPNLRSFSWKHALQALLCRSSGLRHRLETGLNPASRIFLGHILTAQTSNPIMCLAYYTSSLHRNKNGCRNINLLSIGCGYRHPLRPD